MKVINEDKIVDAQIQIKTIDLSKNWKTIEEELLKIIF